MFGYMHTHADFASCRLMICASRTCPVSRQTGCAKHTGWDPVGFRVLFRVSVDLAHHCHLPLTIQARICYVPRPMGGTTWPKPDAILHPLQESSMYCTSLPCRGIVPHTMLEGRMYICQVAPHVQSYVWSLLAHVADIIYHTISLTNNVSPYQPSEATPHWSLQFERGRSGDSDVAARESRRGDFWLPAN